MSKNASSADNQQERIEAGWVVGFVDGEGSFLVNIFKSSQLKLGWQVFPEFNVAQTKKNIEVLHALKDFFGCGHIYAHTKRNEKKDNWDPLYKFCVRNRKSLKNEIIPFFEKNMVKSFTKKNDFHNFVKVIKIMEKGEHLSIEGMRKVALIIKEMTHRKPFEETSAFKFLSSSETIRRAE